MAIVIQPYRPEHEAEVKEFNQRLLSRGADADLVFYETSQPRWLPASSNCTLFNAFFLALEGGKVRGGYALKHQKFSFPDGSVRSVGYYHHPISEGIVDKAHAIVGSLLLRDAMQRSPLLYCLGMGGYERPLPKMLVRLGWSHHLVPFYLRIVHPARFLKEMQALRTSRARRLLMDIAAYSGVASGGAKAYHFLRRFWRPPVAPFQVEVIDEFGPWTDTLWQRCKSEASMTAVRDPAALRQLYPASEGHLTRLRVRRGGEDIGWAVVGEKRKDPKYGTLRVGSIIDCWACAENALAVICSAATTLERLGADLIVCNQSHREWCAALEAAGFLKAPSNFIFAASKKLAELLQPFEEMKHRLHFMRADGDGLPRNY